MFLECVCVCVQELGCENCLLVDFWEATLMASSQDAVIQELLFRLTSVYIDRLLCTNPDKRSIFPQSPLRHKSLKSADDLVRSCRVYNSQIFFSVHFNSS